MGVSACSVALLLAFLGSFVDINASLSKPGIDHGQRLTIHIRKGEGGPTSEFAMDDQPVPSLPQEKIELAESGDLQQQAVTVSSPEMLPDARPAEDWRAIAEQAAKASVNEHFRNEETRKSMWRQSRSIMFQPTSDFVMQDEEPIIAGFRFRPQIHVVGLGVTIGSCFIGLPLAGVPVEERTVAISIFVCAKKS